MTPDLMEEGALRRERLAGRAVGTTESGGRQASFSRHLVRGEVEAVARARLTVAVLDGLRSGHRRLVVAGEVDRERIQPFAFAAARKFDISGA